MVIIFFADNFDFTRYLVSYYENMIPFDLSIVTKEWNKLVSLADKINIDNEIKLEKIYDLIFLEKKCRLFIECFTSKEILSTFTIEEIFKIIDTKSRVDMLMQYPDYKTNIKC